MTANGKSIGEVRAFEELKVQGNPNVADIFSMKRTYKKLVEWENSGGKKWRKVQLSLPPAFCQYTVICSQSFHFFVIFKFSPKVRIILKIICIQKKKVHGSLFRNEVLFLEISVKNKARGAKNIVNPIEILSDNFRILFVAKTVKIQGIMIIKYELNSRNILNNGRKMKIDKKKITFKIDT